MIIQWSFECNLYICNCLYENREYAECEHWMYSISCDFESKAAIQANDMQSNLRPWRSEYAARSAVYIVFSVRIVSAYIYYWWTFHSTWRWGSLHDTVKLHHSAKIHWIRSMVTECHWPFFYKVNQTQLQLNLLLKTEISCTNQCRSPLFVKSFCLKDHFIFWNIFPRSLLFISIKFALTHKRCWHRSHSEKRMLVPERTHEQNKCQTFAAT